MAVLSNAGTRSVTFERSPEIEIWFEFASNYSYLSVMRIEDAARVRRGRLRRQDRFAEESNERT